MLSIQHWLYFLYRQKPTPDIHKVPTTYIKEMNYINKFKNTFTIGQHTDPCCVRRVSPTGHDSAHLGKWLAPITTGQRSCSVGPGQH